MLIILKFNFQVQLQTCYHQYCERLTLNYSNNKYYISIGDIVALVILGETLFSVIFALPIGTTNS